jgi:hypothetical protein
LSAGSLRASIILGETANRVPMKTSLKGMIDQKHRAKKQKQGKK